MVHTPDIDHSKNPSCYLMKSHFIFTIHSGCGLLQWSHSRILHGHVVVTCSSRCSLCNVTWQFSFVQGTSLKRPDAKWTCYTKYSLQLFHLTFLLERVRKEGESRPLSIKRLTHLYVFRLNEVKCSQIFRQIPGGKMKLSEWNYKN